MASTCLWLVLLALGGWWAAGAAFRQPVYAPRALGAAVLAWGWTTLGVLALGSCGWLARGPLLAWAALGFVAGLASFVNDERKRTADTLPAPQVQPKPSDSADRWEPAASVAVGLVLWTAIVVGVPSVLMPVKPLTDAPIYHLYFAAQWWQAGSVFLVPAPFGDTAVTYLPANGELYFSSLMALWGGDRLAKAGQLPFLLLAAASALAIARRLGIGLSAAVIAVSWFVTCVLVMLLSFEANVDTIFMAGYVTAVYFLLRYALGDGSLGTLALGALAAGATWGTKIIGTVFVPPLLALSALAVLWRAGSIRGKFVHLLALCALPLVLAGYWFLRNAWLTGNPLYPLQVTAFGHVLVRGWFDAAVMRTSPFYLPVADWAFLVDTLLVVFDPRLILLWTAALAGAWAVKCGLPQSRWIWLMAALAVANIALYWLLIPYRTQQRFMLPALAVAVVPLAALFDRARWLRRLATGLLALHVLTPQTWPLIPMGQQTYWGLTHTLKSAGYSFIHLPFSWATLQEDLRERAGAEYLVATAVIGVLSLFIGFACGWAARGRRTWRWALPALGTIALVATASALTWYYLMSELVYPNDAPYLAGWLRLDQLAGPKGARIAYAGTNRAYYLMGKGLRNHVAYVNIDAHRHWRLHDYHRAAIARGQPNWPDARPGWDRIEPDYEAWLANLLADRIDYLVVTRTDPSDGIFNMADRAGFPIERSWADAHPESFAPVYGLLERDPEFRIYRVRRRPGG